MKIAILNASKSDAAVIALAARLCRLVELEAAFDARLCHLEERHENKAPPRPDLDTAPADQRGALFDKWAADMNAFEERFGMGTALRSATRAFVLVESTATRLAALPVSGIEGVAAKARVVAALCAAPDYQTSAAVICASAARDVRHLGRAHP